MSVFDELDPYADDAEQRLVQMEKRLQKLERYYVEVGAQNRELSAAADRFRLDSGILTRYHEEGDLSGLPGSIWQVILANLREALTNVIRHAGATEVEIRLQALPGMIRLEVHDNGRGCEKPVEGMGLSGMRERAASLGGTLTAGPTATGGFRVTAHLPLGAP